MLRSTEGTLPENVEIWASLQPVFHRHRFPHAQRTCRASDRVYQVETCVRDNRTVPARFEMVLQSALPTCSGSVVERSTTHRRSKVRISLGVFVQLDSHRLEKKLLRSGIIKIKISFRFYYICIGFHHD